MIDVVFHEMRTANQRLHGLISDKKGSARKMLSFTAGNRTIENAKRFLSRYIVHCKDQKVVILQYIMFNMCFLGKTLRATFLEEILEGAN